MYILINLVQLYEESSTQCNKASKKKKRKKGWGEAKKVIEVHRSQKRRHKTILICNDMAIYAKWSQAIYQKSSKPFLELISEFNKDTPKI